MKVQDGPIVANALDLAEKGMDFADALHLGRSGYWGVGHIRALDKAVKAAGYEDVREA